MIKLGVVALAGPTFGGTYQYTLSMLQALRHVTGFDITVYGNPDNRDFGAAGFPIVPFAETRARQIVALAAHRLHVRLSDPFAAEDMLLAPTYSLALLHTATPFAFTLHDLQHRYHPENFSRSQLAWRHQVYVHLLRRARRVICESNYVKRDIVRFFDLPDANAAVIPAPPQRQFRTDPGSAQLETVRRRLQLPERFLFYPAHFWHHKNHLRLIEAFGEVVKEIPDLKLVLTGNRQEGYEAVTRAIAGSGLGGQVVMPGYVAQEDLVAIYRLAAGLVMPSLFESISIPIYEAFEIGTPVAASNILAIPEQVGDAALLFDPTSVPAIGRAMLQLVDPAVAGPLVGRGRARVAGMTPERYGTQLQELLQHFG